MALSNSERQARYRARGREARKISRPEAVRRLVAVGGTAVELSDETCQHIERLLEMDGRAKSEVFRSNASDQEAWQVMAVAATACLEFALLLKARAAALN